jgi:cytochrome c oxidase subunit IV
MLVARIYGLIWLFVATVGAVLYFTDSFSMAMTILYGFIVSTLAGAGLLAVFPAVMTERHSPAYNGAKSYKA